MNQNIDITQLLQMAAAQQQNQRQSAITYWQLLSLALVVLKATGFLNVVWFWAFFPLFIPYIMLTLVAIIGYATTKLIKR
jgi:hypothetical protein